MRRLAIVFTAASTIAPAAAWGQSIRAHASVQSYGVSETPESIGEAGTLVTLRFDAMVPLLEWLSASVGSAYAAGVFEFSGPGTTDVSGVLDTTVGLDARVAGWNARVTALLPTGDVVGSLEEAAVVGRLSADLIPFDVHQWGTGGGFAADVERRLRMGSSTLGLLGGFLHLRGSEPFGVAYSPATQVRARAQLAGSVGGASVYSLLLGVQLHGHDVSGGMDFYRPGLRIEGVATIGFPIGARESALVYGGIYAIGSGAVDVAEPGLVPRAGSLLAGTAPELSRQALTLGAELHQRRERLSLMPRGEVRLVRSPSGLGQGWLASIGLRSEIRVAGGRLGTGTRARPVVSFRFGKSMPHEGATATIRAIDVGLSIVWDGQ